MSTIIRCTPPPRWPRKQRRREINGARRTYYCGAYWGYGFHEDGVKSALVAVEEFSRRQEHEQPHLQRVG